MTTKRLCDQCGRSAPDVATVMTVTVDVEGAGGFAIDLCDEDLPVWLADTQKRLQTANAALTSAAGASATLASTKVGG